MVCEEARRLKEEALLNTDAEEDARFGESLRGDELPEELRRREDRLAAIVAAKERLETAQREADDAHGRRPEWERQGGRPYKRAYGEPEDKAQSNFTDPDSAKTGAEGFQHNAQVAGRASVDRCDGRTMQAIKGGAARSKRPSTSSPRRCLRMLATAMNGTCRHLKRAASTGTWRRGARARGR